MKTTKKRKNLSLLKIAIIAALGGAAGYMAFAVPDAVQSMVPVVETVSAEICQYRPTVTAKGTIVKKEEQWFAVVAVNEADISLIEKGQTVQLSGAALMEGEYSGRVTGMGENAYTLTANTAALPETVVDVTVAIEKGDTGMLRAGYSVTAQLIKIGRASCRERMLRLV